MVTPQKRLRRSQDLHQSALENRIEAVNGSDTYKEVLNEKCNQLREELGYPTNSKLEDLAIDHVVLCYFNYHCTDIQYNRNLTKQHSTESGLYWEKRLTFTSRRYYKALELLSKMK